MAAPEQDPPELRTLFDRFRTYWRERTWVDITITVKDGRPVGNARGVYTEPVDKPPRVLPSGG